MNSWMGLLKKDFLLMRNRFMIFLLLDLVAFGLGWYLHIREIGFSSTTNINWVMNENDFIKFIPLAIALGIHVFFIADYLFTSLRKEGKQLHLWLHSPQAATVLLGSKLVNGFIALITSLVLLTILITINLIPFLSELSFYLGDISKLFFYLVAHIAYISLILGVSIMFFWTIYHGLKSRIGKLSMLVLIIFITLFIWGSLSLEYTDMYDQLVLWGEYTIEFPVLEIINDHSEMDIEGMGISHNIGENIFEVLLALLLFVLSAWMIEKKVEV
ncbi:hypothetical protein [Chengkuizengella sediminis]|uniref:hypothetical protein n=1 Tax=Chengkuizengella sediminis TaxID=1885917 RepID=UPI00138A116C|nr:hypothetical protein [Chengkuizengella sediminis]NDI34453.1 hypothetical protein [Chengkuizengella sediminis]